MSGEMVGWKRYAEVLDEIDRLRARVAELERIEMAAREWDLWADANMNQDGIKPTIYIDDILAGIGPNGNPVKP